MFGTNKLVGKVGPPVKRKKLTDKLPNVFPKGLWQSEKKGDVGKKRDNEHVHVEHAGGKRERGDECFVLFEPGLSFIDWSLPEVA